ncbi:MAG: NAD-dependent protein deacylase [Oscillospiraceae bacterium]|nr:NAD-dependent protein deacylase [Oscillospiraceae bacterium]
MISELKKMIRESARIVFFGGAGVSTESCIPDFRSEQGLHNALDKYGHPPETILSKTFFDRDPAAFFSYYKENLIHLQAKPNAAHLALARLEGIGKLTAVITQNIDGLHQKAGSKNVIELHGGVARNYCVSCGKTYTLNCLFSPASDKSPVPLCDVCGGMIRPDVVLYQEPLSDRVWANALARVKNADTLIVGGTSLSVYPAAGLLPLFSGKNLVLINKTATPYDEMAGLVIRDGIGKVLSEAISDI